MKTLTCKDVGGWCDEKFTVSSVEDLGTQAWTHVQKAHPEEAARIQQLPKEEGEAWMNDIAKKFAETPEDTEATA